MTVQINFFPLIYRHIIIILIQTTLTSFNIKYTARTKDERRPLTRTENIINKI